MAFIGIKVPKKIAQELYMIEAPGERSEPEEMHITLVYLGKMAPLAQVIRAGAVVAALAQKTKPFLVGCATRTCFSANPDSGVPVIARVQSPTIAKFRTEITKQMKEADVGYSEKYPKFEPHITLSYSEDPCDDLEFDPVIWKVGSVAIWGGEEMTDRIVTMIELEG